MSNIATYNLHNRMIENGKTGRTGKEEFLMGHLFWLAILRQLRPSIMEKIKFETSRVLLAPNRQKIS